MFDLKAYQREYHKQRKASMTPKQLEEFRAKNSAMNKVYRERNPEKSLEIARKTRAKHRDQRLQDTREWRSKNKERVDAYNKKWAEENKAKGSEKKTYPRTEEQKARRNQVLRKRFQNDHKYRIEIAIRTRIATVLRRRKLSGKKSDRSIALLGCSIDFLMEHISAKFQDGMSWDNHGEWHLDHIRPCASFDLVDPDQQKACFHYSNLQPLWGPDNLSKHAKWDGK